MRIRDTPTRSEIKKDKLDNVYYNLSIRAQNQPILAEFNETRQDIIIDNPNDYYMTIARFTVPLNAIPLFIFKIEEGLTQNDPNKGLYTVTLTHKGTGTQYTENVLYVVENEFEPTPPSPQNNNGFQRIGPYYYVYSYQHMISMINSALATAFATLKGAHTIYSTEPPFFYYDENTQLLTLVAQKTYDFNGFYINVLPGPVLTLFGQEIEISVNTPLLTFLDGFNTFFTGDYDSNITGQFLITSDPFNRNVYYPNSGIAPNDILVNPTNDLPPTDFYIKLVQEYKTIENWNSFRNLLFSTNTIPIKSEYIPTLNSLNNPLQGEGINNFFPILTDFEPLLDSAGATRSTLNYVADGQYRLTDMQSNLPLRKFDIKLYWVDQDNNLYPLELQPFTQIKIKFLFTRKELYNHCVC